ncbi:hypothetical protein OGATHE_004418 [Ogataea polymorpha]|uniref:Uncharacterized protein n=1 Tax=Ogataea polymorpha TaxID=460523 RepID=A0A9P8P0C6_9ASCO|nr:hypothetical protein OGATHE_004418 [Ogataea polymorpha]
MEPTSRISLLYPQIVSDKTLLSLLTLEASDRSTDLSATSTIRPPKISGSTSFLIFRVLPGPTYLELVMDLVSLLRILLSNGFAETTVASTTPLYASLRTLNCLAMESNKDSLLFSANTVNRLDTTGSNFSSLDKTETTSFLEFSDRAGFDST